MSLLNPLGLAWAALAVPILALYILKVRRHRQVVPTLMFWDQIFRDTAPRSLWRRLRHWLSLLMQLVLLLLLVLALADPAPTGARHQPTHWLLVLDQSASMQATDGAPTRLDEAKEIAHRIIRALRARDQATVIGAGPQTTIACGRTHHQPTLHNAVRALAATAAPGDLRGALALAAAVDIGVQERRVVVITDSAGAAALGDDLGESVTVHRCGGDAANTAITALAVRPRADNPLELQGILRVANYGPEPITAEVRLTLDGELIDAIWLELDGGEEKLHTFQQVHTGGHVLAAELVAADALAADNLARAVLPEIAAERIVLVSPGNLFLESVLASHPWLEVERVAPDDGPAATASADIVVFDGYVPERLPDKPCLFLYPAKDSPLWTVGEELKNPLITDSDQAAPMLRHVHLRNCTFHRARVIKTKTQATTLVASFEHPLLLHWTGGGPPRVLLALDLHQSDLPWRTAFPILMHNALQELAGQGTAPVSAYATGKSAVLALAASTVTAHDAQGQSVPVVAGDGRLVVGPVDQAGLVTVAAGDRSIDLAFNLADGDESNLRRRGTTPPPADKLAQAAASAWSWPWWVTLVIAAIGLSTTEWGLYQRRRID